MNSMTVLAQKGLRFLLMWCGPSSRALSRMNLAAHYSQRGGQMSFEGCVRLYRLLALTVILDLRMQNHETTQAFIRSLQYLAPSVRAIRVMVTHPTFLSFERRWQLPVYFQLRWKEIVTRLEDALSVSKLEPESNLKKGWSLLRLKICELVDVDNNNDNDANSRNHPICDVLDGCSVVGDGYLLGQKRLRPPTSTSLLEAHVADTKSVSYMDREQSPSFPTRTS